MALLDRQFDAFRAVMMTGGMTAAAEVMRITQPAVSRLISDLEYNLKLRLFERRGNQINPTPEATALMAEVERSYLGLEHVKAFARDLRLARAGSLRIARCRRSLGFLPFLVARFRESRPACRCCSTAFRLTSSWTAWRVGSSTLLCRGSGRAPLVVVLARALANRRGNALGQPPRKKKGDPAARPC